MIELRIPELGEGIKKATVAFWHFQEGDAVTGDDDIVELVTDKASFNIPANASGRLKKILFPIHQEVKIGEVIAIID